jgi:hypothetical protein
MLVRGLRVPYRPQAEGYVQSSIQFSVTNVSKAQFQTFLHACQQRGVYLKWFGGPEPKGYTSLSEHWHFIEAPHTPPNTAAILAHICDMRLPLSLPIEACGAIVTIIEEELEAARS